MDIRFDPRRSLVYVRGRLSGPTGESELRFAVDTGAARTVIRPWHLRLAGYDTDRPDDWDRLVSATGDKRVPLVRIDDLECVGERHRGLLVVAHDPPGRFRADGLLGLDFLRRSGHLRIDFARGRVSLDPPRRWWRPWG